MILTVWAPFADRVEVVLSDGARHAMARDGTESWSVELGAALLADGYRYSLDGGTPRPDPRSTLQADGVHGASKILDLELLRDRRGSGFRARPLSEAVIYELHVGTFTEAGTYAAAAEKLRHLAELGITHVELMPIASFPGNRGWGYDGVDWYAPFRAYGTCEELAAFIDACHARGIAVLLDVVYNHFGPEGNYWREFGPYFTHDVTTPWGDAINFDGAYSDAVRRFVLDNAVMWLRDYQFDGLRLDAVHAMQSAGAVHVLEDLAHRVRQLSVELNRPLLLIAESDTNDPRLVRPAAQGGLQLDAHWVDDFHHSLHRFFTAEPNGYYADYTGLQDVAVALRDAYIYQGQYSVYRRRRHGRPPVWVSPDRIVVSAQNHDQIGNRAFGERLSMLLPPLRLKAIAALTLLAPFVPLLFHGEEWGARTPFLYFTDMQDAALGDAIAAGRRKEFAAFAWAGELPNPQDQSSFLRSKLNWSELDLQAHADLLRWYTALIRIRQNKPHWSKPTKADVHFDTVAGWLTFTHAGVLVAFNFAHEPRRIPLPAGNWRPLLRADPDADDGGDVFAAGATRIFARR
jgi:maltooligosyltrehalose trehalohydrolase